MIKVIGGELLVIKSILPERLEDLHHDAFHLRLRERSLHVVQERGEVLLTKLHHKEERAQTSADGNLL